MYTSKSDGLCNKFVEIALSFSFLRGEIALSYPAYFGDTDFYRIKQPSKSTLLCRY